MKDKRGVERGHCKQCDCEEYIISPDSHKCSECDHSPAQHVKTAEDSSSLSTLDLSTTCVKPKILEFEPLDVISLKKESSVHDISGDDGATPLHDSCCQHPGCQQETDFDINTGESCSFCLLHTGSDFTMTGAYAVVPLLPSPSTRPRCKLDGCQRQCYVDHEGTVYDCCSRRHGAKYLESCHQKQQQTGQFPITDISPDKKCRNPWCTRPRYSEGGVMYDFCGITCRNHYQKSQSEGTLPQVPLCQLPGCKLPCYADPTNKTFLKFCGKNHKQSMEKRVFWELPSGDQKFVNIKAHFDKMWVKYHPIATVLGIYKVFSPTLKSKFKSYRGSLPNKGKERHFHGTVIKCDLRSSKAACSDVQCGICNISRCGFNSKKIGFNIGRFKRFGHGFYLAPNSSKCHDYTKGIIDYRAMLLCNVAPGNKHTLQHDNESLTAPPPGCHSVYGARGGSLNYDEIVLFDHRAIRPKYVILYQKNGIGQIAK